MLLAQSASSSWQALGIFVVETLAVLAVIAAAAWALARFGRGWFVRGAGKGRMKIVERLVLEPRKSIYIVEVDKETMLVGVSDGSVRLLKDLGSAKADAVAKSEET